MEDGECYSGGEGATRKRLHLFNIWIYICFMEILYFSSYFFVILKIIFLNKYTQVWNINMKMNNNIIVSFFMRKIILWINIFICFPIPPIWLLVPFRSPPASVINSAQPYHIHIDSRHIILFLSKHRPTPNYTALLNSAARCCFGMI